MKVVNLICVAMVGTVLFLLSGCRSSKHVAGTVPDVVVGEAAWNEKVTADMIKSGVITAKMGLELSIDGKSISVSGNCNFKKDEVIQLSLVLLGLMEVGRLEFTPEYVMLINRAERQYVKVNYTDIPYLQKAGIDFHSLQALFWGDMFVPAKGNPWEKVDFDVVRGEGNWVLSTRNDRVLHCRFVADLLTGLLRSTNVYLSAQKTSPQLICDYQHFVVKDGKYFPDRMRIDVGVSGKTVSAAFTLNNLKWNDKSVSITQEPTGKYKKVDVDTILKQLIKL